MQRGAARAAVFGVSDGLITNVSLILGVAGASPGSSFVRLAGLAGLLAGAFSMGAGEYISMRAQTELLDRELRIEEHALSAHPDAEQAELVTIYQRRGLPRPLAERVAAALMRDPEQALETHAREELGIRPGQLGSPPAAAVWSFVSFSIGALIPLVPWFFIQGSGAVLASMVAGAIAALAVGAAIGAAADRPRVPSALRQLTIAALAAGMTFLVGHIIGVNAA
ncbi:MAG: VIT1/CCC1 transporter family protein [Actinomycetota bacterium]|nr:VIT1/CCC1 transporter family protein [Actinomycetota bacterium]